MTQDEEKSYDLKKSVEGLGQLYPILIDAHGNVIDGFHRKEIDPKWPTVTLSHIDSTVKLEAARLAANFNRRDVPPEETKQKIGFLVGAGLKPAEIATLTGLSERSVYRYMPEAMKKPEAKAISEAMKEKSEVVRKELTAVSRLVECECCGMGTREPKPFGKYEKLCPSCYLKAVKYPRLFKREPTAKPKAEVKVYKETPEFRRARMHPDVSKMDEAVWLRLKADKDIAEAGWKIEFQKKYCLLETTPEFTLTKGDVKIGPYLDAEATHKNKEERDETLREMLWKRHKVKPLSIPYTTYSEAEVERVSEQIKEALL